MFPYCSPVFGSGGGQARQRAAARAGAGHLFRQTVATLNARVRCRHPVIQEMRRHANLYTTELYTRVSINLLKQVYAVNHPSAHLNRYAPASERNTEGEVELFATLAARGAEENTE